MRVGSFRFWGRASGNLRLTAFRAMARDSPSPWGKGRDEEGRKTFSTQSRQDAKAQRKGSVGTRSKLLRVGERMGRGWNASLPDSGESGWR